MAEVFLKNVSKSYGQVQAVQEFSLEIEDREFLVLLGPSGCGKTTTLRMVAGLEEPTSGNIVIGGQDVTRMEPKNRDIAMVFQNYALYPHMTVRQNMAFGLRLRRMGRPEIERRVTEAADALGLSKLLERRPRELSGGQRQRVALARAMVRDPKAFLMDEPLSNLDAKLRTQTRVELKRLHQRLGVTVLYVTHDQTEAMTLGSRIVVMKDGVIQQVDTPEGIYHKPRNQFVATFIGSPAMNVLEGKIEGQPSAAQLRFGEERVDVPEALRARLSRISGPNVRIGVRPEDVQLGRQPGGIQMRAALRLVEPMGNEHILYLQIADEQSLIVRARNDVRPEIGENLDLTLDAQSLHVFDPATEETVVN